MLSVRWRYRKREVYVCIAFIIHSIATNDVPSRVGTQREPMFPVVAVRFGPACR